MLKTNLHFQRRSVFTMAASASAYEEEMEEEEEEVGMNNIFCSFLDIVNLFVSV